jgi:spermidine/putrescine transport system permease protein
VSMLLYANARGAPTPALNAIATVGLAITLLTLVAAFLVYRRFAGGQEATSLATMEV